jgi:hypothetical protein
VLTLRKKIRFHTASANCGLYFIASQADVSKAQSFNAGPSRENARYKPSRQRASAEPLYITLHATRMFERTKWQKRDSQWYLAGRIDWFRKAVGGDANRHYCLVMVMFISN